MIPLFLGLTIANLLALSTAVVLGYVRTAEDVASGSRHILAGALSALFCCVAHCVVFTYFIATAKWVQHAIDVKRLDPALAAPTRSFKAQAFPAALLAIVTVFLTAFAGAGADNYAGGWATAHHGLAVAALAVNVVAALVEFGAIRRNGALIDGVLARIGVADAAGSQMTRPTDAGS